ncbi:hypothetical protein ACWGE1_30530 [Streptomyces sp. NPDC054932]
MTPRTRTRTRTRTTRPRPRPTAVRMCFGGALLCLLVAGLLAAWHVWLAYGRT